MYYCPSRCETLTKILLRMPCAHTFTVLRMPCTQGYTLERMPCTPKEWYSTRMPFFQFLLFLLRKSSTGQKLLQSLVFSRCIALQRALVMIWVFGQTLPVSVCCPKIILNLWASIRIQHYHISRFWLFMHFVWCLWNCFFIACSAVLV